MATLIPDLQIGDLLVRRYVGTKANRQRYECQCACGKTFIAYKEHILSGRTKSCPDCAKGYNLRAKEVDGWTVIDKTVRSGHGEAMWQCRCKRCGAAAIFSSSQLRFGKTQKCKNCESIESPDTSVEQYLNSFRSFN